MRLPVVRLAAAIYKTSRGWFYKTHCKLLLFRQSQTQLFTKG
jgi:hypothetical protein